MPRPALVIEPSIFAFAVTKCGDSSCTTLLLKNTGDSAITIRSVTAGARFIARMPLPLTLGPGEQSPVECCYKPVAMQSLDSAQIIVRGDAGYTARCFVNGRPGYAVVNLSSSSFDAGDVRTGDRKCSTIQVSNVGNAPMHLVAGAPLPKGVTVDGLPKNLAPGAQIQLTVCVTPDSLGAVQRKFEIARYVECASEQSITFDLSYAAYDLVPVALTADKRVRPGNKAKVSIVLTKPLPASYAMREMRLKLKYDKALLLAEMGADASSPVCIGTAGTAASSVQSVRAVEDVGAGPEAVLDIRCSGGAIASGTAGTPLIHVFLTGLVGNARVAEVRLISAEFGAPAQAGMLRAVLSDSATVELDSLCRFNERLLVLQPKAAQFASNAPNPFTKSTTVHYAVHEAGVVRIRLLDVLGRTCAAIDEGWREPGEYSGTIDASGLQDGSYLCRIEHARGADARIVIKSGRVLQ